jgi:hypothetical protein
MLLRLLRLFQTHLEVKPALGALQISWPISWLLLQAYPQVDLHIPFAPFISIS